MEGRINRVWINRSRPVLLLTLLNCQRDKCVVIATVVRRVLIGWSHIRSLGERQVFPVRRRIDGGRISSRWGRVVWPRYRVMWLTRGIVGNTGRRVGRGVTMSTWNKGMILRMTSKCNTCLSTVLTKMKIAIWSLESFSNATSASLHSFEFQKEQ